MGERLRQGCSLGVIASLIERTFAAMLPHETWSVRVGPGGGDILALTADERELTAHMAPRRAAQFAAGRREARAVINRLGYPVAPILRNSDGSPLWPPPLKGSISHSGGLVAAVAGYDPALLGIGIDLEAMGRLFPAGAGDLVFNQDERQPRWPCPSFPYRLFSAKEATMKAMRQATGLRLGWEEISIRAEFPGQRFVPNILHQAYAGGHSVIGGVTTAHGFSVAVCAVFNLAQSTGKTDLGPDARV